MTSFMCFLWLFFTDSIQMLCRANVNPAIRDRRRAQHVIVQWIFSQHFKLWTSSDHRRQTIFIRDVNLSIRKYRRAAVRAWLDALLSVMLRACFGVETPHDPAIVDHVEIFSVSDGRGHIGTIGGGPQHMRTRDVASTAGFECAQRLDTRWSIDDVVKDNRRSDDAIRRIIVGVETVRTPEFLAVCGIVTGDAIASSDHDLCLIALIE